MKGFNTLNQTNQEVQVMLRIALCDDDFNFMQELHQKLIQWYQESDNSRNISVSEFSDSSYLARTINSGSSFDLLFVDIDMPKMNGMELAKHIRARLPMAMISLPVYQGRHDSSWTIRTLCLYSLPSCRIRIPTLF